MDPKIIAIAGIGGAGAAATWAATNAADASTTAASISIIIGGITGPLLAAYVIYRNQKTKADAADRESRRKDCEELLVQRDRTILGLREELETNQRILREWQDLVLHRAVKRGQSREPKPPTLPGTKRPRDMP